MDYAKVPKDTIPTLIIGLGGTGYQIIKRLKKQFNKRYSDSKLPIRYLLIDTDLKSFLDDSLENNEKCQLRFGDGIKNTLDWAYNNSNFDWLPQNPKITPDFFTSTDQGAGLMRPIGRLYLCKNAKLVYDILSSAKNDLVDINKLLTDYNGTYLENIDRQKVYIVGSLAGGTGCGTFLDVAVMLSNIFNRDNTNIIGMFTLESCYDEKLSSDLDSQSRSKANCYAALKELEFYMSSITNPSDKKYLFKYTNISEMRLEKKLLDVCYLIENRNEMGGVLTNIEDIYDLCALQLLQEVGTSLGSQLRADYANFIGKDKDPVSKRDRHFSTFSSSSMEFSFESFKQYCSYKYAKKILERLNQERSYEEQQIEDETSKLLDEINICFNIEKYQKDFVNNLKISNQILYTELNDNRKGNLDKVGVYINERKQQWKENKSRAYRDVNVILNDYLSVKTTTYGIKFVSSIFSRVESRVYNDFNSSIVNSNTDKEKVKANINSITSKRVKKGKEPIDSTLVNQFNGYLEQEQKKYRYEINEEMYNIIKELMGNINEEVNTLLGSIGNTKGRIESQLDKLSHQIDKKYGGNIISREMASKELYDEYYAEKFMVNVENRITTMFKGKSPLEIIKNRPNELVKLCEEEFEKLGPNISILDILSRNARNNGLSLNEYMKNELDITARLARPFWSAVKNPEVAWTECYYIGSVRDDNINNDFTIKPPEAIERWIRNQTGERSRQGKYVETTNPYAVDIIHITMGACAAYLPDIKHYKQFYLKLIALRSYPLHLDERYIGLQEIDLDTDKLLQYYSLAKAYGVIIEIENSFYLNLKSVEGNYRYIYSHKNCLKNKDYSEGKLDSIPENKARIPEILKLGETYADIILHISEDSELNALIEGFVEDTEKRFYKEELREHCLNYIKGIVSIDFIAKEKLIHKMVSG